MFYLMLTGMDPDNRVILHVLYPRNIAEKHIKAARVGAMLRKTRQDKQQEADGSHTAAHDASHGWRTACRQVLGSRY
jgi:hypothetical protein